MSKHIEVVMSSEDFNADEFLDGITKEWNHLPRVALCANSISQPFRNSSPPPTETNDESRYLVLLPTILYCCPLHESEALQKKKTITVRGVGVLQVPCCQVFCVLWCGSCRALRRLSKTSIAPVLSGE